MLRVGLHRREKMGGRTRGVFWLCTAWANQERGGCPEQRDPGQTPNGAGRELSQAQSMPAGETLTWTLISQNELMGAWFLFVDWGILYRVGEGVFMTLITSCIEREK